MSNNIVNIPTPAEPITETGAPISKKWWKFLEQFKTRNEEAAGTWEPTISATSGTFTDVSASGRYIKRGRLVWFHLLITITTNGSAAGSVEATLPFDPDIASASFGFKPGAVLIGSILTDQKVYITTAAGAYPGADSTALLVTGTYRVAA